MLLPALLALALQVKVGDAAPPVTAAEWLGGEAPDLKDKVVLVEFWGTWCGPCVALMPHVQDLWTRYRDKGLAVAAISYEEPSVLRPFVEGKGYTMPVGSDPEKACIEAFGVKGWPTTVVIDRQGEVVYVGIPTGAEPFVQQALGLETSAATLLTRYLEGGAEAQEALTQLARGAPRGFVLGSWAQGLGGEPPPQAPRDLAEALSNVVVAWPTPALRAVTLNDLAAASDPFDLRAWSVAELGRRFPIADAEFLALAEEGAFAELLDAIVERRPSDKALAKAKGDDALRDWAHEQVARYRENAAFLVFLERWIYGELQGPDEFALPQGTAWIEVMSGKELTDFGYVLTTGEQVMRSDFPACVPGYLARAAVVAALDKRKSPGDVAKAAGKLHDELFGELKKKHGDKKKKPKAG
jgi:peroxiredoxin